MRRLAWIAAPLVLAGVLSACTITVTYDPPPNATPVTANTDNMTPVDSSVTVPSHSTSYFDVALPSSVRAFPLVYFELTADLNLSLINYSSSYQTLASSNSASYFASGTVGLASLAGGGGPIGQSIGVSYACQGSCVIWPTSGATHYYVGVENTGSSPVTFDLYVYGYGYQDSNEPGNDVQAGAVPLSSGSADAGAIETLGGVDWWSMTTTGNVSFTKVSSPVSLRAALYDSGGGYIGSFNPSASSTIPVVAGDYLMIQSANGYAGSSAASRYDLTY
jgi:hypothetical protein